MSEIDINDITLNQGQQEIFDYVVSGVGHCVITGGAGRGKSILVRKLKAELGHRLLVLGTTGIAAVNVGGMTAHSALSLPLAFPTTNNMKKVTPKTTNIFNAHSLEYVLIDEASFLRSDQLYAVLERFKRFGKKRGKREARQFKLILVGDFTQLATVNKRGTEADLIKSSFGSHLIFKSNLWLPLGIKTFQLTKNERTSDSETQKWLEKIRFGEDLKRALRFFNTKCFRECNRGDLITLTTTNAAVASRNGDAYRRNTNGSRTYHAKVKGNFPENARPLEPQTDLKIGLRVMSLVNDPEGSYQNGSVGVVEAFHDNGVEVRFFKTDKTCTIEPKKFENIEYYTNEKDELDTRVIGTFTQLPLKQADAQTCHKAQGATLDAGIIDLTSNWTTHGTIYVLLSRFSTIEELYLTRPIREDEVICDPDVREFYGLPRNPTVKFTFTKTSAFNTLFWKKSDNYLQDLRESMLQYRDDWLDLIWGHEAEITHDLNDQDLLVLRQALWAVAQQQHVNYEEVLANEVAAA